MDELKSKSQKKREAEALQKLGVELVALSQAKLDNLPLSSTLKQAIITAKSLKSHGAIRRQAQLIGKLMRATEQEGLLEAYNHLKASESTQTAAFHAIEQWRKRLLAEDKEALTTFIATFHPPDIQHLRHLVKKAKEEVIKLHGTEASRALFRYLRLCMS